MAKRLTEATAANYEELLEEIQGIVGCACAQDSAQYRGMLYIGDAGIDMDSQGRMIVPKQDFVAASGVKTTLGFGSGYAGYPSLVTLFAFANEYIEPAVVRPIATFLDRYMNASEELVKQGRVFSKQII